MKLRFLYPHHGQTWEARFLKPQTLGKWDTLIVDITGTKPLVFKKPQRGRRLQIPVSFGAHK